MEVTGSGLFFSLASRQSQAQTDQHLTHQYQLQAVGVLNLTKCFHVFVPNSISIPSAHD